MLGGFHLFAAYYSEKMPLSTTEESPVVSKLIFPSHSVALLGQIKGVFAEKAQSSITII